MNPETAEVNCGKRQLPETDAAEHDGDVRPARPSGTLARPGGEIAPHWFELLALFGVVSLGTVGAVGLLLAVTGHYTTPVTLVIALPLTVLGLTALHRSLPQGGTSRSAQLCAAAALVLAVGYGVFAGMTPSQNVLMTRDPGSYASTGRWLARTGTLEVDARDGGFEGVRGLRFSSPSVYDVGTPFPAATVPGEQGEIRQSGHLEFQFNHLASVALAAGYDMGGFRLMFRVPAIVAAAGLLTLYAVTARVTRRPAIALLAPALLSASMPFLYVARNTYSESFAFALLWGAVLVLVGVHDRPRLGAAITGGALLGALVCARVDALLYCCMVFPLAAVSIAVAKTSAVRNARIRAWVTVIVSAVLVGAIGWYDLSNRTGFYSRDLTPQLSPLRKGLVGAAAASLAGLLLWMFAPQIRRLAHRIKRPVAAVAAMLVAAAILFGWLIRPHVQTAVTSLKLPSVAILQKRDGLRLQPTRSYAEDSLRWMAWYLGAPALLAAIGGLTVATWRAIRARADAANVALLVLCLGAGALYWYNPNITPDQLWATRRFIPATFPALTVWAAAFVAALASTKRALRVQKSQPWVGAAAAVATTLVLLVPPGLTTKPLRWQRIQPGYLKPVLEVCDAVGPNGAIIVLGGYGGATLPQTLRGWCGVPVAAQGSAVSAAKLPALAAQIRANGRDLYLVSVDIKDFDTYLRPGSPKPLSTSTADQLWMAEQTVERPPSHYVSPAQAFADPVPTPFGLHVLKVSAG